MKDAIPCKISIDEMPIEMKLLFQDAVLFVIPANSSIEASFALHCNDFVPQADSNQHLFRLYLKSNFEDFLNFFSSILGWKPQIRANFFLFTFASDINRDIILLSFAQVLQRGDSPNIPQQKTLQDMGSLDKSGHEKSKSKVSLSPANKIKVNERIQMKKSQSNIATQENKN